MMTEHPKTVRRRLLSLLYTRFTERPTEMLGADEIMTLGGFTRDDMVVNMFYLADSGLVELITSYRPNWFEAARILPAGTDLVENESAFERRFPSQLGGVEEEAGDVLYLVERLTEQADYVGLDSEERLVLHRDIRYLREELARPRDRWRMAVIAMVLGEVTGVVGEDPAGLPALDALRRALSAATGGESS